MPKRPLTNKDGEVRPLTAEDFKHFRPIAEVDPGMIEAAEEFRRRGRPAIGDAPKLHIGFRLAADVVENRPTPICISQPIQHYWMEKVRRACPR
jgi:uncharacterized protein (DUF4415 family)